jgi:UDPglucose 6-dehydrogenase
MREASSLVLHRPAAGGGLAHPSLRPRGTRGARKLITGAEFTATAEEAVAGADAVVIVTEWPEFGELESRRDGQSMRGNWLVDGRNCSSGAGSVRLGMTYEGICAELGSAGLLADRLSARAG